MKVEKIKFHIDILYEILKKRDFNISNKIIPDYEAHEKFVKEYIYRVWKIVFKESKPIGTYYLTFDNYIGINLITSNHNDYIEVVKYVLTNEKPLREIKSLRNKNFLININPKNLVFKQALSKLNFEHIQNTYLVENLTFD